MQQFDARRRHDFSFDQPLLFSVCFVDVLIWTVHRLHTVVRDGPIALQPLSTFAQGTSEELTIFCIKVLVNLCFWY